MRENCFRLTGKSTNFGGFIDFEAPYNRPPLEITSVLSLFENFPLILEKEEKHSNSDNIEDLRKVQRQTYSKIAKVSLKPFISKD